MTVQSSQKGYLFAIPKEMINPSLVHPFIIVGAGPIGYTLALPTLLTIVEEGTQLVMTGKDRDQIHSFTRSISFD